MRLTHLALCSILLTSSVAGAQPDDPALRARVRARVRVATEQKLAEALKLDPGASMKFYAVVDRFDAQIAELQKDSGVAYHELKQLMDSGRAQPNDINRLADRMLGNKDRIHRLETDRSREVRQVLSPQQYGELMLAWPRVSHEVQREVWKALAEKRGSAAPEEIE